MWVEDLRIRFDDESKQFEGMKGRRLWVNLWPAKKIRCAYGRKRSLTPIVTEESILR